MSLAKCIKVEIPTGEVLLVGDELGYYDAANTRSAELIDEFTGGPIESEISESEHDGWVLFDGFGVSNLFKVIAQYGDEFPA